MLTYGVTQAVNAINFICRICSFGINGKVLLFLGYKSKLPKNGCHKRYYTLFQAKPPCILPMMLDI